MSKSRISDNTNKRKAGRPVSTGTGELIGVRLLPDLLDAVDKHKEAIGAESRPDAIRHILRAHFTRRKMLKPPEK